MLVRLLSKGKQIQHYYKHYLFEFRRNKDCFNSILANKNKIKYEL